MNFRYPTSVNSMGFGGYPSFNREVDETPKVVETFIDSSKIQNNNRIAFMIKCFSSSFFFIRFPKIAQLLIGVNGAHAVANAPKEVRYNTGQLPCCFRDFIIFLNYFYY